MKKASALLIIGFFLILVWSVGAQTTPPAGYFKHGGFFCSNDPNFEKPDSGGLWPVIINFCQPQAAGCQMKGELFCPAKARNTCCSVNNACGKGTSHGVEVAVCVPPTPTGATCTARSPGYAGTTKEGKNVCCSTSQEPGPAGGTKAPYCQPKSALTCAAGERFVQGTGEYQGEKRCCAIGTIPGHHPNGLPFCANLPLKVLAPNGGEQISKTVPYQVKWTATNISSTQLVKIRLINSQGGVDYQNNFPNTGSRNFLFASNPPGQYKIELSATIDGQTVTDQSDNFFTLTGPLPDTTPPMISLDAPLLLSFGTSLTLFASDPSGLTSSSFVVISPQGANPILKTCNRNNNSPTLFFCTLIVPKSQWVLGTIVSISATDYSPNKNVNLEVYKLISSSQLQKQDTSGSKIIVPPTLWCHIFNTNLRIGMTGSEVTALQTALTRAGFPVSESGSFDERTASAVSSFQLQYRSELLTARGLAYPTGYFGPTTRQKMNQLWGCG